MTTYIRTQVFFILILCLCSFLTVPSAHSAETGGPVLTIAYNAYGEAYFDPCKSCGGLMGGIAPRSAVLKEMLKYDPEHNNTLFIAGPHEFVPNEIREADVNMPRLVGAFMKAYADMGYQRLYVLPEEKAWLNQGMKSLPNFVVAFKETPVKDVVKVGDDAVGIVLLPVLSPKETRPSDEDIAAVEKAVEELRAETKLVVAVSPWSKRAENYFYNTQPGVFDLILGYHAIAPGGIINDGMTMLARAGYRGQRINIIDIWDWPSGSKPRWKKDETIITEFKLLDEDVDDDPEVYNLFEFMRK